MMSYSVTIFLLLEGYKTKYSQKEGKNTPKII